MKKIFFLISIFFALSLVFLLTDISLAAEVCTDSYTDASNETHTGDEWCAGATSQDTCSTYGLHYDFCSLTSPTHESFSCKWIYTTEECVCDPNSYSTETCITDGCVPWECEKGFGCGAGQCYQECGCSDWTNDKCGGNACASYLMHQTRECQVIHPDCPTSRCVSNQSCSPDWYPACPFCLCDNPSCQCGTGGNGGDGGCPPSCTTGYCPHYICTGQNTCGESYTCGTDSCQPSTQDVDCVGECLKCENGTCVTHYDIGCTDSPACEGQEAGASCEEEEEEEEEECYPPFCCYFDVETAVVLTETGVDIGLKIINDALDNCKPGANWQCVDSTAANYPKLYSTKKNCENNCLPPTGPPLLNRCSCTKPFDVKKDIPDALAGISVSQTYTQDCSGLGALICASLELIGGKRTGNQVTIEVKLTAENAGEVLWNWILKPYIASQIQNYSVIGSEGCEICTTYEGEKNVIFHPAIHIPQNFCLVYNLGDGSCTFGDTGIEIPFIGGEDIQLAPGICAWLGNIRGGGRWGDIWVNLNPFVKANTLEELIQNFINFLLLIGLPLALLFFILGGVMFMTASGNPERVGLARRIILYTAIGLVVILFAKGIFYLIQRIIGG